ncbi:hypothetical protein TSAR_016940 [Trichomalopsis sarcophagae]|uniref:Uncharacterized protein n=1 Tax=Trichomalopsis sarcophagae TaxID=543379 RepID=A0A232EH94_9HYME|nr:hypothetical protein TSAR_016940 [Trichomalopsis sarcophagae]
MTTRKSKLDKRKLDKKTTTTKISANIFLKSVN